MAESGVSAVKEIPCRDTDPCPESPQESSEVETSTKPQPSPMAFTIDFGGGDNKKLDLKGGIKRFAPPTKSKTIMPSNNKQRTVMPEDTPSSKLPPTPKEPPVKKNTMAPTTNNNVEKYTPNHSDGCQQPKDGTGSETGTYTIENEEEEEERSFEEERQKIKSVFGVKAEDVTSEDWVAQWASSSASRESSLSGSKGRRKLPATPNDKEEQARGDSTEGYLQDTFTAMASLEARISKEEKKKTPAPTTKPKLVAKQSGGGSPRPAAKRLTRQQQQQQAKETELAAWHRRKNYDPLRSAGLTKPKKPLEPKRSLQASADESDSCSEVESAVSIDSKARQDNRKRDQNDNRTPSSLRTLSLAPSNTDRRNPLARTDVGRLSMRSNGAAPSVRPVSAPKSAARTVANRSVRSSSSLSCKEVEFQAWKRRKNYNPMRAAAAGTSKPGTSVPSKGIANSNRPSSGLKNGPVNKLNKLQSEDEATNFQRSASFHYPDGRSRIQHNVYTSEDDSLDESFSAESNGNNESLMCQSMCAMPSNMYEVDDDELMLTIPPRKHSSGLTGARNYVKSPPSRGQNKLEALDNLVISTIFSISTKLCLNSAMLIRKAQDRACDDEQQSILDTLTYVLEDTDPPASPSKKTSRELAGTLRNLKKVEQALQALDSVCFDEEDIPQ